MRLLLAAGADREQRTSKGRTAEMIALEEDLLGSHKAPGGWGRGDGGYLDSESDFGPLRSKIGDTFCPFDCPFLSRIHT